MSKVDEARKQMDTADLVIATMVESKRSSDGADGYANPHSVAAMIGGAPPREVGLRMFKMRKLGVLERAPMEPSYQLTILGVELLSQDVGNFQQSPREERRREAELMSALGR